MRAIDEHDRRGEEDFLEHYGFGEADTYVMRFRGRAYASKAIVGVAYGYQYPEAGPLRSGQFSGGKTAAALHLMRLGFEVDGVERRPGDWTLAEVEAAVREYFRLLALQRDRAYVRKRDFAAVQAALPGRNESSVSRKFSNISAILEEAGLPLLQGFPALGNKQTLLSAILYDWLDDHVDVFDPPGPVAPVVQHPGDGGLEVEPPSSPRIARVQRERRAVRVDFAARDENNRKLGEAGERWAVEVLKAELTAAGRPDLAGKVVWVSSAHGDGLGYDIASFDLQGRSEVVEVKTTNSGLASPFIVTANEVRASLEEDRYVLMRVFGFADRPRFYRLRGSLKKTCALTPLVFGARPGPADDGAAPLHAQITSTGQDR